MLRALTLVVVLATPITAGADPIAWEAPAGCPDGDTVRARVEAHLGRAPEPGDVDVALHVSQDGARWRVEMTIGEGVRELEAATCDELAESAALIVAMTIDEAAQAAPPAVPDLSDPPAPLPPRRQVDTSERRPSPPTDVKLRARTFVVGDLGTMPEAAIGAGGAVEVALDAWGIEVAAARMAGQRAFVPGDPENGARVDLTSIATRLCYTADRRRLASRGCLGVEVEIVGAEGFGFNVPLSRTTTFGGGPHFGVGWAYRLLGPLSARLDIAIALLLVRPVLTEGDTGVVIHDPNLLIWRGSAGLEATW